MIAEDDTALLTASADLYSPLFSVIVHLVGPRGSAVEHHSLASVLSPSCARPVADG